MNETGWLACRDPGRMLAYLCGERRPGDRRPVFPGHALVVPRRHVVTLLDLGAAEVGPYFQRVHWVTGAVQDALAADGSFVAINKLHIARVIEIDDEN